MMLLSQRSLKLSSFLKLLVSIQLEWFPLLTLPFLTCSSVSPNTLLILISVPLISAVAFFSSVWFFVLFSQFH